MAKRRLGRGLDALLGRPDDDSDSGPGAVEAASDLRHIRIDSILDNPYQPRRHFDEGEMKGLIESVLRHGVVQPIVVRPADGGYQLVAGQRRLRAATEAGLHELPARVIDLEDQQLFEITIIENLQRQDLNAIEKGWAFRDYLNRFGVTHEELAERLGAERSTVTNFLRLLELPDEVQNAVQYGRLSAGHARALLPLESGAEQLVVYRRIMAEGLSVRQVESAVAGEKPAPGQPPTPTPTSKAKSNHVLAIEQRIREAVGAKVEIKLRGKDRGRLIIHFNSNDEFRHLMDLFFRDKREAVQPPGS